MEIEVDPAGGGPRLLEPDDFKAFKVVIRGAGDRAAAGGALEGVAEWVDDGHVAVAPEAVRALAGDRADDPDWQQGLAGMVAYAESKGWTVDGAIRAHVEWPDAAAG